MALEEYRRKRDFRETREPSGKPVPRAARAKKRKFVIQKHDASHLHYDFRLELDGVLVSWAVPKGPSLNPSDKRLAMHVEDHPLDYASFEGTIPEGQYGAGEVIVWDRGTWTCEGEPREMLEVGKLEFELDGEKLRGAWLLLKLRGGSRGRANGNEWLLIKRHDEFARSEGDPDILSEEPQSVRSGKRLTIDQEAPVRKAPDRSRSRTAAKKVKKAARKKSAARSPRAKATYRKTPPASRKRVTRLDPGSVPGAALAPFPKEIEPQLAQLVSHAPEGEAWVHEIKFDGYRILAHCRKGSCRLMTRSFQDWTGRYPRVAEAVAALPGDSLVLDGEIAVVGPDGLSSFQALQNLGSGSRGQLVYFVFDLLYLNGYDLRSAILADRRALLAQLLAANRDPHLQLSEWLAASGEEVFRQACKLGLEGIISKRKDRAYIGARTSDWQKTKCVAREELVIGGYAISDKERRGLRALLLGYYDDQGRFRYAGRVGTGVSDKMLAELRAKLDARAQEKSPFVSVPRKELRGATRWARPELVAQIEFTGWTEGGHLRHPAFLGLREDKPARSVTKPVQAKPAPAQAASSRAGSSHSPRITPDMPQKAPAKKAVRRAAKKSAAKTSASDGSALLAQAEALLKKSHVTLTHPERILYEDMQITKLDLAAHYALVAPWMLPHLQDRPLSLVRCPDGQQGGKRFYQKHTGPGTPKSLKRVIVPEKRGQQEYVYVTDLDGLLGLVQMSVLEIHPWGARRDQVDKPDRLIFDLDPGDGVPWSRVVEAAAELRDRLQNQGLTSFLKTTGGKGLHVVMPISPRRHEWAAAKQWARDFVESVEADHPEQYVTNMSKAKRKGKIFLDYLRNDRGATAVAAYSSRVRAGAPVSVPLRWDELSAELHSDHFNVRNLPARMTALKNDPWEGYFEIQQCPRMG